MAEARLILEPSKWRRPSRGSECQFFADDSEIEAWLSSGLPENAGPYTLVGSDVVRNGERRSVQHPFEISATQFTEARSAVPGRINFWVRSAVLTPVFPLHDVEHVEVICSYNGLILIQHGCAGAGVIHPSRIAHVPSVINVSTRERIEHSGYARLFRKLKARIQRDLRYACTFVAADGTHVDEVPNLRMTEGAARLYRDGVRLAYAPGRRL